MKRRRLWLTLAWCLSVLAALLVLAYIEPCFHPHDDDLSEDPLLAPSTNSSLEPSEGLLVSYRWARGSVPPPGHYSYTIVIGPGPKGSIEYLPDYSYPETPIWVEEFDVESDDLSRVAALASEAELLPTEDEEAPTMPGAPSEVLEAEYSGRPTRLDLDPKTEAGRRLVHVVESLVPEEIWHSLRDRRTKYVEDYTRAHPSR